ncbi:MAG: hypothetical protein WA908_03900 [Pontixanthobacter sp.]
MMLIRPAIIAVAAFMLTGCDLAKEQIGGQVRTAVVEQCRSVSDGLGIAGDFVSPICECTADTLMEKNAEQMTQIDRARVEEIVRICAQDTGADVAAPQNDTSMENSGG